MKGADTCLIYVVTDDLLCLEYFYMAVNAINAESASIFLFDVLCFCVWMSALSVTIQE